ncbi:MAG: NYN domain-containing protein [Actinomycetota bacterium]
MTRWLIDGNNVMGSRPDGWWNDPLGAAERLTQSIAEWCRTHDDEVVVVYDGRPEGRLQRLAGGNLTVDFATRPGRDAADDRIVELAIAPGDDDLVVVTSDRGLRDRLPEEAAIVGAGSFRSRLD